MPPRRPAFIPFRTKMLLGVLAVGGVLLGFMTLLLHSALRSGMAETLGSSMATAAAGMAPGLEAAAGGQLERVSSGHSEPSDIADLRTGLIAMRTRMIREFPTQWLMDSSLIRQPDLLIVMHDREGIPRVVAATRDGVEGQTYRFPPSAAQDGQDPWEHLSYDTAEPDSHAPGATPDAPRFDGRSPLRLPDGRRIGLLVVDADAYMIESVTAAFRIIAAIIFAVVLSVLAVCAYALAWWLNRPVRTLDTAMARVAAGDFSVQLPSPNRRDEFDGLVERFNTMVLGLKERNRMRSDLDLASEVQRHLLPSNLPAIPGYELIHAVHYSDETGGDALDCFPLPDPAGARPSDSSRWALSVGDVSGHGIAAAMLMSWTRATLRARAEDLGAAPAALLQAINRHFFRDSPTGKFLTFYYAMLDASAHTLHWASAGHEPALVITPSGVRRLGSTGVPLGVLEDPEFAPGDPVALQPGDLLYLGTDGVSECRSPTGELLGRPRLEAALVALRAQPIEAIRAGLLDMLAGHQAGAPQSDDLTFLLLRRTA